MTGWTGTTAGLSSPLGGHQAARKLDEDTLARERRPRGEDHPDAN
jgi:hypothetical protein